MLDIDPLSRVDLAAVSALVVTVRATLGPHSHCVRNPARVDGTFQKSKTCSFFGPD